SLPGGKEGDRNPGDSGANAAVLLARGANGAIYRRDLAASRARSQQEGWSPMAPAVEGPVVAVAAAAGPGMLLALDGKGAALQAQAQAGHAAEKWTALGGTFTGRLTALGLAKSVELFAADAGGTVFHRSLDAQTGTPTTDWQRVGAGTGGALAAVR